MNINNTIKLFQKQYFTNVNATPSNIDNFFPATAKGTKAQRSHRYTVFTGNLLQFADIQQDSRTNLGDMSCQ